jgi:hypothetical protein
MFEGENEGKWLNVGHWIKHIIHVRNKIWNQATFQYSTHFNLLYMWKVKIKHHCCIKNEGLKLKHWEREDEFGLGIE